MSLVSLIDGSKELRDDLASSDTGKGDALIITKQPFSNTIVRTQHDKNTEWVSAKDFGAVGDGITDDTAALQAAFNYAAPTDYASLFPLDNWTIRRRKLFIPAGFYKTTAPLLVGHGAYIEFEGEDFWLLKKSGRRAMLCPEFTNQIDWCIKSATYNMSTGTLLPYDKYVTGAQIDSNVYNQTFVTILNLSILPTTRLYGGLKIAGGPHSRIENFDIQRCDYSVWMSASWCSKLSGISYHIRAGICCLDSENGASVDVRSEGYWDAALTPLAGGYDLFGPGSIFGSPVSATQRLGVFVNLSESIHFPRLTMAGEHVGIYARLSNVSVGALFAENITRYSIYGYRGQFDIGVLGGISGGPFSFLASGSNARIGAWKRADAVVPTMDFLHSDNLTQIISVGSGLHYFNKQVTYGDFIGVVYVSAASGNDNYTGFGRAFPVATLDAALVRIVSLLNDGTSPYKKVTINILDGNQVVSAIRTLVGVDVIINANSTSITFNSGMYLTLGDNVRLRINAATIIPTSVGRLFYVSSLHGTSVSLYNCTTQLDAIAGESVLFYVDHFVLAESLRVVSGTVTTNANSKVVSCPSLVNQTNFIKLVQVNATVSGGMTSLSNKGINFTSTYIGNQVLSY